MSFLLAGVMSLAFIVSETGSDASETESDRETYAVAYRAIAKSGRPMVVMVGTDWCPPCRAMKGQVLPELRKRRWFRKIVFARVNAESEAGLAKRLTGGGPVPQLVMFRKTEKGWVRRKLIGGQPVEVVERFIEQGIALDEADKRRAAQLASRQRPEAAAEPSEASSP